MRTGLLQSQKSEFSGMRVGMQSQKSEFSGMENGVAAKPENVVFWHGDRSRHCCKARKVSFLAWRTGLLQSQKDKFSSRENGDVAKPEN